MSKSIQDYFQNEIQLLNESIHHFTKSYPQNAANLHLDTIQGRDPHIERLLEGCAYLTARVKQQIDVGVNHIGEAVLRQLAPVYLAPQPAMTIVEFTSPHNRLTSSEHIPSGIKLISHPVGEEQVSCEFQTLYAMDVHPIHLSTIELHEQRLQLVFNIHDGVLPSTLTIRHLSLYIHASSTQAYEWYYFLTRQVERVNLIYASGKKTYLGGQEIIQERECERSSEAWLSESEHNPFHSLRRYFHFSLGEQFVTIDLKESVLLEEQFTVEIEFSNPVTLRLHRGLFKLHCVPAINLFLMSGEPIRCRNDHSEYPIVLSQEHSVSKQLYAIARVLGITKHHPSQIEFEDLCRTEAVKPEGFYYRLMQTNEKQEVIQSKFVFSGPLNNLLLVSFDALACNGYYPNQYLNGGDLYLNDKRVSLQLEASNITRPNQYQLPKLDPQRIPSILMLINANLERFKSVLFLKRLLSLHDERNVATHLIESISAIHFNLFNRVRQGIVQKGVLFKVIMNYEQAILGEVALFGKQLHRLLHYFKPINFFLETHIELKPSGQVFIWDIP
ncbi:type VI secretion system baseplate subunit TssF [Legionella impletisoli]|uniref:Type VI secretion protein n=1 Tax=Legionella impletisoli TaxID=343510 RepID=A0A917JZL3_9GAMM|nr:type VI secretion system baseplate subunit TssF [Legionella impletisoli]GGI89818.1 hypothetical protein GCM10007966_18140 [Legionella impletisoli]